jgi:hypothetical protein
MRRAAVRPGSITRHRGVLIVAIIAAVFTPTAAADSSVVQHLRETVTLGPRIDNTSCSFPITVTGIANVDDLLFFDSAGNLVRLHETVNQGVITFSANGKTLEAKGTGGIDMTFNPDGTVLASTFGIDLLVTLPGSGPAILDAGRGIFTFGGGHPFQALFEAGPASYDFTAFCAALAA